MTSKSLYELDVITTEWQETILITDEIRKIITESKIKNGLCVINVPHSTAGITVNSYLDEDTSNDMNFEINRLVPTRVDFMHIRDTPTDASGHIKSSLIGIDLTLIIKDGELIFGRSQGIFFWEFDGPRDRKVFIKIIEG
jgi:secondary thiamine-phosphate synthase enzyme